MTPSAPYTVDSSELTVAIEEARDRVYRAQERLARVACAHIAESVRDILTDHDPDPAAPFDARTFRLTMQNHQVVADGTYWTASGEERRIAGRVNRFELAQWTNELHRYNRDVWESLCLYDREEGDSTHYRLDLAQAAALPVEIQNSPRVAEIRDRLAASTRRPWSSEEIVYNRNGGIVSPGDPDAVHTDFVVSDADRIRVAEIAVNHDGPGDTETPEEDIAASRANADLIARAPEDLAYLIAYLDHVCGGEDAEELDLRGSCGHCGTALYTSVLEQTPVPLDSATECQHRRLPSGRTLQLQHVLRT
ncbi:hypothetical protein ABT224_33380 [Streptomyces sp. NPDC001584]|uniref:hypothetical protein n=1 Tax=Streptomyces sp. NPDC001584 TaxID=3154521 RepID=UPI00332ED8D2